MSHHHTNKALILNRVEPLTPVTFVVDAVKRTKTAHALQIIFALGAACPETPLLHNIYVKCLYYLS